MLLNEVKAKSPPITLEEIRKRFESLRRFRRIIYLNDSRLPEVKSAVNPGVDHVSLRGLHAIVSNIGKLHDRGIIPYSVWIDKLLYGMDPTDYPRNVNVELQDEVDRANVLGDQLSKMLRRYTIEQINSMVD